MSIKAVYRLLLILSGLCIGLIGLHATYTFDDLYFLSRVRENGIIQPFIEQYLYHSGRFTAYFLNDLVLSFEMQIVSNLIMLLIVAFTLITMRNSVRLFFPALTTHAYFMAFLLLITLRFFHETIFWQTQSFTYLLPFSLGLFFINGFNPTKKHWAYWAILLIGSFYIGASSEIIAICFCVGMLILCVYNYRSGKKIAIPYFLAIGIAITALVLSVIAPGNLVRSDMFFTENSITVLSLFKWIALYFYQCTWVDWILHGLSFIAFVFIFSQWKSLHKLKISLGMMAIGLTTMVMLCLLFRDVPPARTMVISEIFGLIGFSSLCSMLIKEVRLSMDKLKLAILVPVTSLLIVEVVKSHHYFDSLSAIKEKAIQYDGVYYVRPELENCLFFHEIEFTTDPYNYRSQHVRMGWGLKKPILLKD